MVRGSSGYGLVSYLHCCFLMSPRGGTASPCRFLSRLGVSPQLSPYTKKKQIPPPATSLASKHVNSAVRAIASAVPSTVLNTCISSVLCYEIKHNYHLFYRRYSEA